MNFKIYETKPYFNEGGEYTRVRSSVIYAGAFISLFLGVIILNMSHENPFGMAMVMTAFPILLLYPFARWLIGGRDSVAGIILAAILSILFKGALVSRSNNHQRKKC